MTTVWGALIVAISLAAGSGENGAPHAAAAAPARRSDAVEVFTCGFDRAWDQNYDGWPDRWQRRLGAGLPHYVPAEIAQTDQPDNPALQIRLDGGGAYVESPCFSVSEKFSYKFEARLQVTDVRYARARLSIEFCDEQKHVLQRSDGPWRRSDADWTKVEIGPINPVGADIRLARVVLHVRPGRRADLQGTVALDDVWVARLPKMTVRTNSPFNVYTDPREIEVTCVLSGILNSNPEILFELLDASSHRLEDNRVQLEGELIDDKVSRASEFVSSAHGKRAAYTGITSWRPPIEKTGFYRIRVTMNGAGMLKRDVINVAYVPPLERPPHGEFGWSLPAGKLPMRLDDLAALLPRTAVHWVKMPVWYGESEEARGDELVVFTEQLAAKDIEVVGVLDRPPAESELAKRLASDAAIADALATDPSGWMPLLDPVLTRLSLRVRWWQLGNDLDASFAGLPAIQKELARLRDRMFRFGQDVNLGIGWNWILDQPRQAEDASWEFQQFSASPPLTGAEIGAYLGMPGRPGVRRWVLVEPLPRKVYDLETRSRDLVEQMLSAKIHGADAIFAARPFDDDVGLMTARGMPGELLLPWRTTASLLGGVKYVGSLQLPQASHNRLFESADGTLMMAVWSDQPATEVINLGQDVRIVDVWGRETEPPREGDREVIAVEQLPKFLRGVDRSIAQWNMAARFGAETVPSVFGVEHPNKLEIQNAFPQGVGGYVELIGPKDWRISPRRIDFKLASGETAFQPFKIALPFDADSGLAPIRADFFVDADKPYRFSVFRELKIGDDQIEIEANTRLDADGSLIVEQRMVNHSPNLVDFKCYLTVPGRRRQRMQVFRLGSNPDVKLYRYPQGAELLGPDKVFWLKAQEVNGSRVLNVRFVPEQ